MGIDRHLEERGGKEGETKKVGVEMCVCGGGRGVEGDGNFAPKTPCTKVKN